MLNRRVQRGFTLIEMAIVLVVIGLLLGSLLTPLSSKIEHERYKETTRELENITEALMGHAVATGRLPCADLDGDGLEDIGVNCSSEGNVPWATLGVGREDAWGHPMRYRVDSTFSSSLVPILDPADTSSNFSVVDRSGAALTPANPNAPVVILFSCGQDGLPNGENEDSSIDAATCENLGTPDLIYVQDIHDTNFDDILVWMSKNRLLNRMVTAGKWP